MFFAFALALGASPAQPTGTLPLPAWLGGCWTTPTKGGSLTETWLGPAGGVMVGASLGTFAPHGAATWEHLQITAVNGKLTLTASPSGQDTTSFPATSSTESAVVFENPAHDFPQRITYTRTATGVEARVEARKGDDWKGFTLSYTPCPPAPSR